MTCTREFADKMNKSSREYYTLDNINFSSGDALRTYFVDRIFSLVPRGETDILPVGTMVDYYREYAEKKQNLGSKANLTVMPHVDHQFITRLEAVFEGERPLLTRTSNGETNVYAGAFAKLHKIFDEWMTETRDHWSVYAHDKIQDMNSRARVYADIGMNGGMSGRQFPSGAKI